MAGNGYPEQKGKKATFATVGTCSEVDLPDSNTFVVNPRVAFVRVLPAD